MRCIGRVVRAKKMPVTVEVLLDPQEEFTAALRSEWNSDRVLVQGKVMLRVETLEGPLVVDPDDVYLIRGVDGEVYPIRRDIFHRCYWVVGD